MERSKRRRWLAAWVGVLVVAALGGADDPSNPLAPPDTSSPRATLRSFLGRMDDINRVARTTRGAFQIRQAVLPKARATLKCLDMRDLAPSIAETRGFQAAVCLKEVLDRVELPPDSEIPDEDTAREEKLSRWRVPGTEVTLIRLPDGAREGDWVFGSETVAESHFFFERARHLPYRKDAGSPGIYDLYVGLQGWMIPAGLIRALPAWARDVVYGQAVWQWASALVLLALGAGFVAAAYRVGRTRKARARTWIGRSLPKYAFPLAWMGTALVLDELLTTQIRITGELLIALKLFLRLQIFIGGIIGVLMLVNGVADLIIHRNRLRPEGIDSQLVRLGFRVLTFFLVAWLAAAAADYVGIPVTPLIAGLGVSGLAVALAAQHTIENLIAGLVLFADKPVRVGDFCQFGQTKGTVEQIGLRSTRVRQLDRTVVTIPNAEFAKLHLINHTRRDRIQFKTVLQLRYETGPDQLRYVLARLREMLAADPRIDRDPRRARFVGYGAWSLDVEVYAYVLTQDWSEFLCIQEEILLRIMDIVAEAGTGFAFPAQTEYQASDIGVDADRARAAEESVRRWREEGRMEDLEFDRPARGRVEPAPHLGGHESRRVA